ncbi:GGDEF domain-containing protein [Anaerobacillus isosaccharinicus]|uniref:GGDEF domain-containing protein n=1 Tax=Anaerobacillus isosaccharinicus TaxID=1532552 RepID=A0A1S2KYW5_9BACI|nr:GGDEF domain-containing protein [Anaerobacillus isosaccharinicus]MBA5586065.1 GGDEF domain-containing protein [Anaerobacillus isosaccharinicus]QOY35660.1 GGDEF domain-containing protein [Anaerobacillus isosaccharinicus]
MKHVGRRISLILSLVVLLVAIVYVDITKSSFLLLLCINQIVFLFVGIRYDQTKTKAERDHLTNLYNRVFISERLPKLLKKKSNLAVCIVDIDCFKSINDSHGHHVGDDVIKRIAYILESETRKADFVVRWGGDEFLIIAPNLNNEFLISLNGRINRRLELISQQYGFPICVSMGIATCAGDRDIEAMIQLADENMYSRKREKQNRLNPHYL